ncbi:MAG: response regulator [Steroidobacteraceae bacterium]
MTSHPTRILVLDDEEAGLYVKVRILNNAGYETIIARTGKQALDLIESEQPDLAILDVQLPDMMGTEICARLKQSNSGILILQTSATFVRGRDRAFGLDSGADAYLTEPIEPDELLATVRALLRIARAEAELRNANELLEQRVQQRTRELADTNKQLLLEIKEREHAEEALRQSQKMEALGQLTGGITHDFNNLLTVIYGGLETIQRKLEVSDPKVIRAIDNSMAAARRAASFTERLLAFARRQPLQSAPTDPNHLVEQTSEILRRTLGDRVELSLQPADAVWWIDVDGNQLENCLLNLAVNARDAMLGQGRLTIATTNQLLDAAVARSLGDVQPGEYVCIAVSDNGKGIAPEILDKVFDPFFSTKPAGQGTGLGLSQVYGFIKQSGGHVRIDSTVGKGTTVTLYLPRTKRSGRRNDKSTGDAAVAWASDHFVVLVVEDNDAVRANSSFALAELGYQVLEAVDAAAALEQIRTQPQINLMFTDISLPGGMDGWQLAIEARKIRPDLKVLYTTGFVPDALLEEQSLHLLRKPFTFEQLAERLRNTLA